MQNNVIFQAVTSTERKSMEPMVFMAKKDVKNTITTKTREDTTALRKKEKFTTNMAATTRESLKKDNM